jgi:hypothetical protein
LDIDGSVGALAEVSEAIFGRFSSSTRKPEEVAVELSLKVGAAGNLVVASGSIEGSVKVALKYKP